MKQFNYCYILVHSDSEIFSFSFLYFFPLLTSGKDLRDYKHHHILGVEQRFSEDSCLSLRFRGFIPVWKTSDPQKSHTHWLDLRHIWAFSSLLTAQDYILCTGSPCPTLSVGCWSLFVCHPVQPGHGLYQAMLTCRRMSQHCLNLSSSPGKFPAPGRGSTAAVAVRGSPLPFLSLVAPGCPHLRCRTSSSWVSLCN